MKSIISIYFVIFISIANADEWHDYKQRYGLSFNFNDDLNRLENFKHNLKRLSDHNLNPEKTWKMAPNPFFHMRFDEFSKTRCKTILPLRLKQLARQRRKKEPNARQLFTRSTTTKRTTTKRTTTSRKPLFTSRSTTTKTTSIKPTSTTATVKTTIKPITYPFGNYNSDNEPPTSIDFKGLLQPIQDQKTCGSCWAFAVMAQQEAIQKIKNPSYNTLLSPQYLVDCDFNDSACNGGWPETTLNWLKSSGKNLAPSMAVYPYKSVRGTCRKPLANITLGISSVTMLSMPSEQELLLQLAKYGPQVVAVFASSNFQRYGSGVFTDTTDKCFSGQCDQVNHAVLLVGYGNDPLFGDYWIIKNSWGTLWGENGYMRLARNSGNMCNVSCWPTFAY